MSGPGTELKNLIPEWITRQNGSSCGCKDYQKKMDRWGVGGCLRRREQIVEHLMSQRSMLPFWLRKMPEKALRIAAEGLLEKAIRNARTNFGSADKGQ